MSCIMGVPDGRRTNPRRGERIVTGRSSAHFHKIEWEGLQGTWVVEDLVPSPVLPPGSERIELWRDGQYRIDAKVLGTFKVSSGDPFPDQGNPGEIIQDYRIEGSSHRGGFRYELDHCTVAKVSTTGTELEADLRTYRVRRTATRNRGSRTWLTEWYLNMHDRGVIYPRSVKREFKETYRKSREYPEEDSVFEGQWTASSGRYAFVETPELSFAVEPVSKELGPSWCRSLSIEYRDEWSGGIPDEEARNSIANAVSFLLGRPLIGIGHTAFDEKGHAVEETVLRPAQADLEATCRRAGHRPVNLEEMENTDRFEVLMSELVPRYLALNGELDLDNVLWGYWLFDESPLGANLPVLATSLEMLKRTWHASSQSKSSNVYMKKTEFDKLLGEELAAIEDKLQGTEYGNRMMNRIRDAYRFGANESVEFFLEELGLPIGSIEKSAMRARNKMAHGSAKLLDESRYQEMIDDTLSYRILFNRIVLKILGYDGAYIDYSSKDWSERPLDTPLAGRR